jgi:beta-lactamase regulating signal transducer with metallopeptidase domain
MVIDLLISILVNHLWQSTLFAACIWGLTLLLCNNSARVRYSLWLAASLKFLVPFALLAAVGTQIPWQTDAGAAGNAAVSAIVNIAGDLAAPMAGDMLYPALPQTEARDRLEQLDMVLTFSTLIVWLIGALLVAVRWMARWIEIWGALRKSAVMANIDFPVPVLTTEKQFEPGVVGILRPKLLLPAGIEERLSPEQMRAVLAHERCHLRWRDNFTASLHMLVQTLFWFFPPVWWIGKRLIEERERACDEQVVRDGHTPESYAEGILNVCEHYIASRLPCVSGVSGSDLRKRIENIVRRTLGVKLDGRRKLILAATACCAVATPIAAGMISGSTMQVLFSLEPGAAALMQYWQVGTAQYESSTGGKSGADFFTHICRDPQPGAEVIKRQNSLATLVQRLPAGHDKALLFAVAANSRTDVKRLLAAGAPRNGDGFIRSDSLMHIAAQLGDVQMLDLLANAGFDIDERTRQGISMEGSTPLMTAISSGRMRNARWLIERGADVNAIDQFDNSALVLSMAGCRDKSLVSLLLQGGAIPNRKALRMADHVGFELRTDAIMQGPPLQRWRAPSKNAEAKADYDGDGKLDHAALFVSVDGNSEAMFVRLSSRNPNEWIKAAEANATQSPVVPAMLIAVAKPGTYPTACAKGFGKPCAEGEGAVLTLENSGIEFAMPESASSIVYWNDTAQKFDRVWISD